VKLKAEFPNAQPQLWPRRFVNIRLLVDTLKQVVVIPTGGAVQRGSNGTSCTSSRMTTVSVGRYGAETGRDADGDQ
jgi:hypothetical protein